MKKIFLFAMALMSLSSNFAQVLLQGNTITGRLEVTPKAFSYKGILNFTNVAVNDNPAEHESVTTFTIYNDEIEEVKSFSYKMEQSYETVEQRRKKKITLEDKRESVYAEFTMQPTWEEIKGASVVLDGGYTVDKGNHQLWPEDSTDYLDPVEAGLIYPIRYLYWKSNENKLYRVDCEYKDTYQGDWEERRRTRYHLNKGVAQCNFQDFDNNSITNDDEDFTLSQTLFNMDEKYEFIVPTVPNSEMYVLNSRDVDGDGEDDHRTIQYGGRITGFDIVSEDGTVIQTVRTNNYNEPYNFASIMKINEKLYFVIESYDGLSYHNFYRINPEASSITRMGTIKGMSIKPAVVESTQDITVELDEGCNAKEIVVVNAAGQIVKCIPVVADQRQIKFNASSLSQGINVVNAQGAKWMDSHKIIVK